MDAHHPMNWFMDIPIVSRVYFTASFLTTAACALELISPLTLYFNYKLIFEKGQVWRLVTNFLFFGMFSLDFLFHMYFLVRYCRLLEENSFRGRTADFVAFLVFGVAVMTLIAPFVHIPFFGSSLTFMMTYVWGRRNEHVRMSFLGLFPFSAPYLPYVLFTFSLVLGNSATVDLIGIITGHLYFYLDDVYPDVARIRGWTPMHYLRVSDYFPAPEEPDIQVAVPAEEAFAPAADGDLARGADEDAVGGRGVGGALEPGAAPVAEPQVAAAGTEAAATAEREQDREQSQNQDQSQSQSQGQGQSEDQDQDQEQGEHERLARELRADLAQARIQRALPVPVAVPEPGLNGAPAEPGAPEMAASEAASEAAAQVQPASPADLKEQTQELRRRPGSSAAAAAAAARRSAVAAANGSDDAPAPNVP